MKNNTVVMYSNKRSFREIIAIVRKGFNYFIRKYFNEISRICGFTSIGTKKIIFSCEQVEQENPSSRVPPAIIRNRELTSRIVSH